MAKSLLVVRNFVSGICELKHKNLKNVKNSFKKPRFLPALIETESLSMRSRTRQNYPESWD